MSDTRTRLLVVEDDDHLASALKLNFELEGYDVHVARTVRSAGELLASRGPYDALLLDVMLPDGDGYALCHKLRDAGNLVPIVMLTARGGPHDRVRGLDSGADDYVPKPFALDELLARMRSVLRRRRWDEHVEPSGDAVLAFGRARINFETHEATVGDEPIKLTSLELDLLRYFARNAGRVIGRDELLEHVWKLRNYPNTRTVDNFIVRLRRYFEPNPEKPVHFVSHRGSGYKFVPSPAP